MRPTSTASPTSCWRRRLRPTATPSKPRSSRPTPPTDRSPPYPASKRSAELLGHSYHHIQGIDFTALRFFTVYGPRGRPDMLAYKLLDAMRLGQPMPLYNGGQMHRDWTFVSDI